MNVIKAGYKILTPISDGGIKELQHIEKIGRLCYKSEDKITPDGESAKKFVKGLILRHHEAMLEHGSISVLFTVDRGVTHEMVRHRVASFAQESTRYVASSKRYFGSVQSEEDVIYAYTELGLSMKKIAEKSNGKYKEWNIWSILEDNGIPRRGKGARCIYHEDFFEKINTPEKAYLLGFIQADGSIRRDLSGFTISQKDENIWFLINMIRDFIQENAYSSQVINEKICHDLYNKGIVPNKTYDDTEEDMIKMWKSVPYDYKYDFIRGLMDGDGCLSFHYQTPTSKTLSGHINFNGNGYLLAIIRDFLSKELNKDRVNFRKDKYCEMYRLDMSGHDACKLLCERMYKNFVFPYGHPKTVRYFEPFGLSIPVKYSAQERNGFNVILPSDLIKPENCHALWTWGGAMLWSEIHYAKMIDQGATPQIARSVLPNSTKADITVTANYREWRHIFNLRAAGVTGNPHPQIVEVMKPLLEELKQKLPIIFDDIE